MNLFKFFQFFPFHLRFLLRTAGARDAGISDSEIDTHGYSVVAIEQMPKVVKLAKRIFQKNELQDDIFLCSEATLKRVLISENGRTSESSPASPRGPSSLCVNTLTLDC